MPGTAYITAAQKQSLENCLYRYKLSEDWGKLHIEELCDYMLLVRFVLLVKSRRIQWTGHVIQMWET
jgi:hypothetical protein